MKFLFEEMDGLFAAILPSEVNRQWIPHREILSTSKLTVGKYKIWWSYLLDPVIPIYTIVDIGAYTYVSFYLEEGRYRLYHTNGSAEEVRNALLICRSFL